jgi:ankyrin repeat protein
MIVTIAFITLKNVFPSQNGYTALHWASEEGHPKVVKLLVQSHANVNVKDNVSTESPHYSTIHKNVEIFAAK